MKAKIKQNKKTVTTAHGMAQRSLKKTEQEPTHSKNIKT